MQKMHGIPLQDYLVRKKQILQLLHNQEVEKNQEIHVVLVEQENLIQEEKVKRIIKEKCQEDTNKKQEKGIRLV